MEMLHVAGLLKGVKNPGKVQNRRVAKLRNFSFSFLRSQEHLFHHSSFMGVGTALKISPMSFAY